MGQLVDGHGPDAPVQHGLAEGVLLDAHGVVVGHVVVGGPRQRLAPALAVHPLYPCAGAGGAQGVYPHAVDGRDRGDYQPPARHHALPLHPVHGDAHAARLPRAGVVQHVAPRVDGGEGGGGELVPHGAVLALDQRMLRVEERSAGGGVLAEVAAQAARLLGAGQNVHPAPRQRGAPHPQRVQPLGIGPLSDAQEDPAPLFIEYQVVCQLLHRVIPLSFRPS